ncbi:putative CDT1 Geminin-binding domain, DNA replication factor Cdt1 [Helianthus annuus]|nr:putative CDT1 Geminin-binding domain, DNA replication factor Cdt1 [Helianthus annuus]
MNSTGANTSSFEPKKLLRSSSVREPLKTPEKPANPPRRVLTRRQQSLRSVKQIREAAKQLQKPNLKPSAPSDPLTSDSTEVEIVKPNAVKSLPEKYEMLNKFFHSLTSSVRLLRLKGSMSSFTNISRQVQSLTDRSFGYNHLGQIKYIMPEAIEIKKILIRDDRTSCMKPDLHITLNFAVVEHDEKMSSDSGYLRLTRLFRSRLVRFCKSNPEGEEVPQEELPEPFNQSSRTYPNAIQKPDTTYPLHEHQPMAASHMPPSFKRRFSKQVPIENVETDKKESSVLIEPLVDHSSNNVMSPVKWSAKLPETPIKGSVSTPSKLVSTPFTATPAQSARAPVRCLMTPDEESTMSPSKLTRRSSGRGLRSITFDTPVKNKTAPAKRVSSVDNDDDDLSDILSHDLLASIRKRELKVLEENNPEISQAKWRKQMIARLPKLFDTLLFYFQSIKRTVITKPELVNMIVSNQLEIVDPREIEEQLRLLLELAPEWVYEKTASSGDLLFCVNKISSPESIRTRLSEAN